MLKTLASATVDLLLHHGTGLPDSGESVRLTQALAGQGVSPIELSTRPVAVNPGADPSAATGQILVTVTGQVMTASGQFLLSLDSPPRPRPEDADGIPR